MNFLVRSTVMAWLLVFGTTQASVSVDDVNYFARHANYENVKISPDGQHLAATYLREGRMVMAVLRLDTRKPTAAIEAVDNGHVLDFYWANNQRLIYSIASRAGSLDQPAQTGELYGVNADGSNHIAIYGFRAVGKKSRTRRSSRRNQAYSVGSHVILSMLSQDPTAILIAEYRWKGTSQGYAYDPNARATVYRLNVDDGSKSKVDKLPINGGQALVDQTGEVRFAIGASDDNRRVIKYKVRGEQSWQEFSLPGFYTDQIDLMAFGTDPNQVYLTAVREGESTTSMVKLDFTNGATEVLFNHPRVDIDGFLRDPVSRELIGLRTEPGKPEYSYLAADNKTAAIHKALRGAFAGQDVGITSATADGSQMVISVRSDTNPGDFFLLDAATAKAQHLLRRRSWVDPKQMTEKQPFSFTARDGRQIDGYLSLPKTGTGPFAAVVNPHGGPHGIRDRWEYDPDLQFLTSRGYAVLQVNFRGSGGYGADHLESGYGQWGAAMQDDVTDATQWAIDAGHFDANRICIYGGSYGGYASLMGVVREPDLYRCAIGYVGVYDLEMMFEEGDIPQTRRGRSYLQQVIGEDKSQLTERSPAAHIDRIKAELFIVHGGADQRVPVAQAKQLRKALKQANKPFEWLVYNKEGHGFWKVEHRAELYRQLGAFLDKHTAPSN